MCVCLCVYVCVCACVCARACVRTYNHIKISYTEICTDKKYIYITKFQRYILIYVSYQYGTGHNFNEVKDFIV